MQYDMLRPLFHLNLLNFDTHTHTHTHTHEVSDVYLNCTQSLLEWLLIQDITRSKTHDVIARIVHICYTPEHHVRMFGSLLIKAVVF